MTIKNKGGRPKTEGKKPAWMLYRAGIAIEAFQAARDAGKNYDDAVEVARAAVKKVFGHYETHSSYIKKILKVFMPENSEEAFVFKRVPDPADPSKDKLVGEITKKPIYPRAKKKVDY